MSDQALVKPKTTRDDVTLKDIAAAVGKSVAAVSRALNNHEDISPDTREYIKRVAREMGYAPSDTLGFILPASNPRVTDPYLGELLTSIACEAALQGFDLLVSTYPNNEDEEWSYLRLINSRRVDGMIIARPRPRDERVTILQENQFPFVVIGTTNLSGDFLSVSEDEHLGAQLVIEHLVSQGHERIALINAPTDLFFALNFRAGFLKAMQEANLPVSEELVTSVTGFTHKDGYQVARTLLSRPEMPTAVMVADDVVAVGVMSAIQDQGLEVGSDVVVTGYGDVLLSEYSQPPLTTVRRPTSKLGQFACRLLTAQLATNPIADRKIVFKPSLVIRHSSDLALWL
jgi:LacI family transcriptional regulator